MTHSTGRTGRRIGGVKISVDLGENIVVATPGGVKRIGPLVAELLEVLLRRHPDPVPFQRLVRELYPTESSRPSDVPDRIRNIVKHARQAIRPLGFDLRAVQPLYAEGPSGYEIIKLKPKTRGMMVVPPPQGFEL